MRQARLQIIVNLLVATILICESSMVEAQKVTIKYKSVADSLWEKIGVNFATVEVSKLTPEERLVERESHNRLYRDRGVTFWERFPDDPRKYLWLENTIGGSQGVNYFINPKEVYAAFIKAGGKYSDTCHVEYDLVREWESKLSVYSNEYLNSSMISNERKSLFKRKRLQEYIFRMQNPAYRNWAKINIDTLYSLFIQSATEYFQFDINTPAITVFAHPLASIEKIFSETNKFGINKGDIEYFLSLVNSNETSKKARDWVLKKRSYLLLYQKPFDLVVKLYDGEILDIKSLQGKVVLVDFWATWCAPCIAMQPRLKRIYDKYRAQGFEVVSLSIDSEEKKEELLKIKKSIGADWMFGIIGGKNASERNGSLYRKVFNKYGFRTVPVILVLNKKGILVAQKGEFKSNNFERMLEKWLDEPYDSKGKI